jgi:hypothetical protein
MLQDEIAKTTGGHAFHSNNGLKDLLEQVVEDGANYYTLTYAPSNKSYDGALRNIRVELSTKGYQLAYRRSYYADDPDSPLRRVGSHAADSQQQPPPPRKVGDSLAANMQHGAPMAHEIVFRAHVHALGAPALATPEQMSNLAAQPAYFRVRRKNRPAKPLPPIRLQSYAIEYAVATQPKPGAAAHPPSLEVAAAAFDIDGTMLNGIVETSSTVIPPKSGEADRAGFFRAQQQIDVPLNATSIRIAVRDVSTDRIGAMEVNLPLAPEPQTQATVPAQSGSAQPAPPKPN